MQENTDENNFEYGHFSPSVCVLTKIHTSNLGEIIIFMQFKLYLSENWLKQPMENSVMESNTNPVVNFHFINIFIQHLVYSSILLSSK